MFSLSESVHTNVSSVTEELIKITGIRGQMWRACCVAGLIASMPTLISERADQMKSSKYGTAY